MKNTGRTGSKRRRVIVRGWPILWVLVGCPQPVTDESDTDADTDTDVDTDTDTDTDTDVYAPFRIPDVGEADGTFAASHIICTECHTASEGAKALKDASGRAIGPAELWPGSMMAHASRDPLFLATLAAEKRATEGLGDELDRKCFACHAPAAWADATLGGGPGPVRADLSADSVTGDLARDGANCMGCHLQPAEGLGDPAHWSGQPALSDERKIFGPHRSPMSGPMMNLAGFTPTASAHIQDGELCATCHTLQTAARAPDGSLTGHELTEQGTFLEWRASAFNPARGQAEGASCQACHMPTTDEDGVSIRARIARNPEGLDYPRTYEREPVARHLLLGGNTFVLGLIREHREVIGSPATDAQLGASIEGTRAFLAGSAAVDVGEPTWEGARVELPLTVRNLVGHKLPTAYPSRRAWLHVSVTDALGETVFEVGGTDGAGRLVDGSGAPLPTEVAFAGLEPHRTVVETPTDVVVWQSWMADGAGAPTTVLSRGGSYAKDSRLLPLGWAPTAEERDWIGAVGVGDDPDFVAGSDGVRLRFVPGGTGPWTVRAEVRYQAFSPRFLDELLRWDTPESKGLELLLGEKGVPVEVLGAGSVDLLVPR